MQTSQENYYIIKHTRVLLEFNASGFDPGMKSF